MKIKLTSNARIRIVVGTAAICVGLMDIESPAVSARYLWLREWITELGGRYAYTGLLFLIGILFITWAILESLDSKGDKK